LPAGGDQAGDRAVLVPHVASFGAEEEGESSVVAEVPEGEGGALVRWCVRGKCAQGLIQQAGLRGLDAEETPAGDGEVADGNGFEAGARVDVGDELLVEGVEFVLGFGLENETFGVESVSAAIAGGAEFACSGFGAAGQGAVGSGRSESD